MKKLYSVEDLETRDLLALTLREKPDSITIVELINRYHSISSLLDATISELEEIKGIGKAKATQLKATIELSRRLLEVSNDNITIIKSPEDAAKVLIPKLSLLDREHFVTIALNTKNQVLKVETVSIGTLNSCIVHPREIFKNLVKLSAASFIIAHPHPSQNLVPSKEDRELTKRIADAGKLMGIDLLDHLIIGKGHYYSMKERGDF